MKKTLALLALFFMITGPLMAGTKEYLDTLDGGCGLTMTLPDSLDIGIHDTKPNVKTYMIGLRGTERFALLVSIINAPSLQPDTAALKKRVLEAGTKLLPRCVEKEVGLVPVNTTEEIGYYYRLTDNNPRPGEFTLLIQGQMLAGKSLVTFTYLFNNDDSAELDTVLSVLKSIKTGCTEKTTASLQNLLLTKSDIGGKAILDKKLICKTFQVQVYYTNPEAYGMLLPPLQEKEIQSVEKGSERGSVMYFRYKENIEKYRGFFTGLFYGDSQGPSMEHPEEFIITGDIMIIFCFPRDSELKKEVISTISNKLK